MKGKKLKKKEGSARNGDMNEVLGIKIFVRQVIFLKQKGRVRGP